MLEEEDRERLVRPRHAQLALTADSLAEGPLAEQVVPQRMSKARRQPQDCDVGPVGDDHGSDGVPDSAAEELAEEGRLVRPADATAVR